MSATGPKAGIARDQSERLSLCSIVRADLVRFFPASRFAFPVLGEQLP